MKKLKNYTLTDPYFKIKLMLYALKKPAFLTKITWSLDNYNDNYSVIAIFKRNYNNILKK